MTPSWMYNPAPERERRAREALEIAVKAGADVMACYTACGLPDVFSYDALSDSQLAKLSETLRIAGGFYE